MTNRQEMLRDSIDAIVRRAGIDRPEFHLTSVSRDHKGVFILQTTWPQGRRLCASLAEAVTGFPAEPYTTCVALLPELVEEIIMVARAGDEDETVDVRPRAVQTQ